MPSTAISAQGTTLKISTGSGGAKTITAVAVGNPTILTSSAHGFSNGDVITFNSGFTGTNAASLNGITAVVKNKTANTFAIDVDTTGLTITAGTGSATPNAYTQVKNINSYSGFDGQPAELDKTNLDSTAKELTLGLPDYGQITVDLDQDNSDAGQAACLAAYNSQSVKNWQLTLPNANVASFAGYVKQYTHAGGVDQIIKRQMVIRVTGAVTWA